MNENDEGGGMSTTPSEQELLWAKCIKREATTDDILHGAVISDFEFLHQAIYSLTVLKDRYHHGGKQPSRTTVVEPALVRLRLLRAFKERNGILHDGSVEEAARDFRAFSVLHPGFWQSLGQIQTRTKKILMILVKHTMMMMMIFVHMSFVSMQRRHWVRK